MLSEYKTIITPGQAEIIVKKSRFIGQAVHAETEQDAVDFIKSVRAKYHDARHNCFAYVTDLGAVIRYGDDGEPQGTAGTPILETIRNGYVNACVVVTRYFGGTLLGTGGLTRAYSDASVGAIAAAGAKIMRRHEAFALQIDYSLLDKIMHIVHKNRYFVRNETYSDEIYMEICVPQNDSNRFKMDIIEISAGNAEPRLLGELFL